MLLAATVPDAVSEAGGMVCQISVYPRGWLTIQVPGAPPREDIELAVVPDWARPPEGRTGTGAHYVFETRLAKATLQRRWARGSVAPALYLADSEATVWSEWYRGLAEASVPPRRWLPRDLWELEVDVDVADVDGAPAPPRGMTT